MPRQIQNAELQLSDVPDCYVPGLASEGFTGGPSVGSSGAEWQRVWDFALTFDGYRYFGADGDAGPRLEAFSASIENAYRQANELPAIDLALLRACLFIEQRKWCKHSMATRCPPELASYLDALLRAIRANIT